jgi:glutamate-1-semialdehyde 2,1-aminomutase
MPEKKLRSIADSEEIFLRAKVGGTPLFIKEASGCTITDIDGNDYIDYVASYGPAIVGHANERVVAALSKAIGRGTSYGAPTEGEVTLASIIVQALPSVQMVRFVNSGTEATMSAIRLARAATKRDAIVKCIGCYHGHADQLLVQAGSGALTHGTPSSPGVPESITSTTLSVHYNDLDDARKVFDKNNGKIAGFIVEPIAGNTGVIVPTEGYLEGLRQLCDEHGAMLIFDEVMTGFRVAWGGAQILYNIKPDITCLGKVIGGGLPVGAYAARRELMEMISPSGPVYQAGTLSGNPLAMAAGIATLEILRENGAYETLEQRSAALAEGLADAAKAAKVPVAINRVGSMLNPFFVAADGQSVTNYAEATASDIQRFAKFFHAMLDRGIYLPPSQYEAWFVGLAHDDDAIKQTIKAARESFKLLS